MDEEVGMDWGTEVEGAAIIGTYAPLMSNRNTVSIDDRESLITGIWVTYPFGFSSVSIPSAVELPASLGANSAMLAVQWDVSAFCFMFNPMWAERPHRCRRLIAFSDTYPSFLLRLTSATWGRLSPTSWKATYMMRGSALSGGRMQGSLIAP